MHSGNKSRTKSEREKGTGEILEAVTTGYFPTLKSDTKWDKYLKKKKAKTNRKTTCRRILFKLQKRQRKNLGRSQRGKISHREAKMRNAPDPFSKTM